ncbi:MAG: choice-of-anchor D domain-containing protein, partial [Myxococcaceae bacterium]|nr:choice-of-anchor D domain-containing protein [Myxococcaceae bacterium]
METSSMKKHPMTKLLLVALTFSVVSCKCGTTRTTNPALDVLDAMGNARTSVDFGDVQVNIKSTQELRIRNSGNALLTLTAATFSRTEFATDSALPFDIGAGDEAMLKLTFTPTVADQRITGKVTFASNDPMKPTYDVELAGRGVTAVARVAPAMAAFADVYVGDMKTLTLTLTNAGSTSLPVVGGSIAGSSADVTGDFTSITGVMLASGESKSFTVTYRPTITGTIGGQVVVEVDPAFGGDVTVPITGRGTQSLPRMCFKLDDQPMERCTDQVISSLDVPFGPLCDNFIYGNDGGPNACTAQSGQRSGTLYFRNEGNVPVQFSVRYRPYLAAGTRCPGLPAHSDFVFSNVPVPDGGAPGDFNAPTVSLPLNEMVVKPWETTPVRITYRASSRCPDEIAEQAQVLWTRQGDQRTPGTLFMVLSGSSLLPAAKAKTLTLGQQGLPASVPLANPISMELVTNEGVAPLNVTAVQLMEELPFYLPDGGQADGGGPGGGLL